MQGSLWGAAATLLVEQVAFERAVRALFRGPPCALTRAEACRCPPPSPPPPRPPSLLLRVTVT